MRNEKYLHTVHRSVPKSKGHIRAIELEKIVGIQRMASEKF